MLKSRGSSTKDHTHQDDATATVQSLPADDHTHQDDATATVQSLPADDHTHQDDATATVQSLPADDHTHQDDATATVQSMLADVHIHQVDSTASADNILPGPYIYQIDTIPVDNLIIPDGHDDTTSTSCNNLSDDNLQATYPDDYLYEYDTIATDDSLISNDSIYHDDITSDDSIIPDDYMFEYDTIATDDSLISTYSDDTIPPSEHQLVSPDHCIICNIAFSDDPEKTTVNITAKGLQTCIHASLERRDGKQEIFNRITAPFLLHKECRIQYTHSREIKQYLKRTHSEDKLSCPTGAKAPKLRSSMGPPFRAKEQCLFCNETLSDHPREKSKHSLVTTVPFVKKLQKHIQARHVHFNENDNWGSDVHVRINGSLSDLGAGDGRYHRACMQYFLNNKKDPPTTSKLKGRPTGTGSQIKLNAFANLCKYIEEEEECQYTLQELKEIYNRSLEEEDDGYSVKMLQIKLKEKYGSQIVITEVAGKSSIFSFKEFSHKILRERWENEKSDATSKKKIIEMAATYILDDIRTAVYDSSVYPEFSNLTDAQNMVPESLQLFLESIIKSKAKESKVVTRKCCSIAHSIISATRPRSFVSPMLLSIAVYIHKNFESKELITVLNSLGFSAEYREVKRLYGAFLATERPAYDLQEFTQFIFDNADINVATLTGHNTFHALGGIASVTPARKSTPRVIPRSTELPTAAKMGKFGTIPIKKYKKPTVPGLKSAVITPLESDNNEPNSLKQATALQSVWLLSFPMNISSIPNWSGFMNIVITSDNIKDSSIVILPFINLNPSDLTTIYSALCFAVSLCHKYGLLFSAVTMDQPLYIKAAEIIAAKPELNSVLFAMLGGFHMAMSYMGSIGHIMGGSGIEQLWEEVYAPGSVNHMMTGHAYSRALRAHYLTSAAVTSIIMKSNNENELSEEVMTSAAELIMNPESEKSEIQDNQVIHQIVGQSKTAVTENEDDSRTVKLWKQYLQQVIILCLYMYSERSGDMELQKYCIRKMIPIFHAAGHLAYAKCARLYLQQLEELKHKVDANTYQTFINGLFTVSGNFTDQSIEYHLMRLMKTAGGLKHGRSITDSTMAQFVHALPHTIPICEYLEQLTGVYASTSEQHKDLRPTSRLRDKEDLQKLFKWLESHSPCDFTNTEGLVSLTTGEIADDKVNCDKAYSISTSAANAIAGQEFTSIALKRTDKVVTFNSHKNKINVRGQTVDINPTLLFHRITCVLNNSAEMEMFLTYELAPYPLSLFDTGLMRKNQKAELTAILKKDIQPLTSPPDDSSFVIDGGFLLRKYTWDEESTFKEICQNYIGYILRHYGQQSTVVFDGYDSAMSTKRAEQKRRASKGSAPDILFDANMKPSVSQKSFLMNRKNKSRLITMLKHRCSEVGISTCQAEADADYLIVSTARAAAESTTRPVVVVGNDADLVVMLTASSETNSLIYIMLETNPANIWKINQFQTKLNDQYTMLLDVMHCLTGCDTTSACYRRAKQSGLNVLKTLGGENIDLLTTFVTPYDNIEEKKGEIVAAGEMFLLKLYSAKTATTLDRHRYIMYNKKLKSSKITSTFQLESLPPTSAAAAQHSYRAYHAVQQNLGTHLNPLEWGWVAEGVELTPVYTTKQAAPDKLMKMISCGCKSGCVRNCSCVKLGVHCSVMCSNCNGQLCKNIPVSEAV